MPAVFGSSQGRAGAACEPLARAPANARAAGAGRTLAAAARALGTGFVPIRKPGKLPAATYAQDYALEYGSDRLEVHADAVAPGARVLIVDDVLATGGTLSAALALAHKQGASVVGAAVLLEIQALQGRSHWDAGIALEATLVY